MDGHIQLYEHQLENITPLIKSHLPASIFIHGSLVSPSPSPPHAHVPRVWSTIPPPASGDAVPLSAEGTFIVSLPSTSGGQVRVFDSLESTQGLDEARVAEGRERVVGALKTYVGVVDEELGMVGGLHELWAAAVEDQLGDGVSRPGCGVWFPPSGLLGVEDEGGGLFQGERRGVEGYEVDIGREADVEDFSQGSDIARDPTYYAFRLPWSTVIRPISTDSSNSSHPTPPQPPVCRVLTSPDGSLGTLSTHPLHRRLGLAQWVINEHIRSGRGIVGGPKADGAERRAYAVIFDRNTASRGMFSRMGWTREWGCFWVAIGRGGEAEERRRRDREVRGLREELRLSELAEKNTLEGR